MDEEGRQHLIKFIQLKIHNGEVVIETEVSLETAAPAVLTALFQTLPDHIQAEYRMLLRSYISGVRQVPRHPDSPSAFIAGRRTYDR